MTRNDANKPLSLHINLLLQNSKVQRKEKTMKAAETETI